MRILLFSGKGGVGKTTMAAATALGASKHGRRTLVLSTDAAHSLSDSLGVALGAEPQRVAPNLDAVEIDVNHELERGFGPIQSFLSGFLSGQGLDETIADEMAILPGMEELFSLLRVAEFAKSDNYDVLVVDCAPTGETVRMLAAPDVLRFYFRKIFPAQRLLAKTVRPLAPFVTSLPVPDDEVFVALKKLYARLEDLDPLLRDPKVCSVRIVLIPEKMVIAESERLLTYLGLFGYAVDLVIANRVISGEMGEQGLSEWVRAHEKHLARIRQSFDPLPIVTSPMARSEIQGLKALERLQVSLFGDHDPSVVRHEGKPPRVTRLGQHAALSFDLPFADADKLKVVSHNDELSVTLDNWRRNIVLPRTLVGRDVVSARLSRGRLSVRFGERKKASRKKSDGEELC